MPEEIIIPDEPQYRLQYALLTAEQYDNLNAVISTAKGYPDSSDTQRYAPAVPQMSAEIKDDEDTVISPSMCVMPITAEVQELYPEVLEGLEFVNSFTPQPDHEAL